MMSSGAHAFGKFQIEIRDQSVFGSLDDVVRQALDPAAGRKSSFLTARHATEMF